MYVVGVVLGQGLDKKRRRRRFLVDAPTIYNAKMIMEDLNIREIEAGERLFSTIEYIEPVEFEQKVMEI